MNKYWTESAIRAGSDRSFCAIFYRKMPSGEDEMKHREFIELIEANPIVAAIKSDRDLEQCLASEIEVVFVLYGDVLSIKGIVERLKRAGKAVLVHMDLIEGLAQKEISVDFIKNETLADGIISTKSALIRRANTLSLNTVMRFFMIDSLALGSVERQSKSDIQPDIIEMLPGILLPDFIKKIQNLCHVPLMASGLITSKSEIISALKAGVIAISTTDREIWAK